MCLSASTPAWQRVRHWSAPDSLTAWTSQHSPLLSVTDEPGSHLWSAGPLEPPGSKMEVEMGGWRGSLPSLCTPTPLLCLAHPLVQRHGPSHQRGAGTWTQVSHSRRLRQDRLAEPPTPQPDRKPATSAPTRPPFVPVEAVTEPSTRLSADASWWSDRKFAYNPGSRPPESVPPRPRSEKCRVLSAGRGEIDGMCSIMTDSMAPALTLGVVPFPPPRPPVCPSLKIQTNFKDLRGCTVIEGSLVIMSGFETMNLGPDDYLRKNLSFPELREITDYLLVFKAGRVLSFSTLFPNLAVIRGNKLLGNWALIIFQNENLAEIGLLSLTSILHGGVKIIENPSLCYVNTVDWKKIVNVDYLPHINIEENREYLYCPAQCPSVCPQSEDSKSFLCWTEQDCQRVAIPCPASGAGQSYSCYSDNNGLQNICNQECLGGCNPHDSTDCWACRNVRWESSEGKKCNNVCPHPLLVVSNPHDSVSVYKDWICINETDCSEKKTFNNVGDDFKEGRPLKSYDNKCIEECPRDTKEKTRADGIETCVQCFDCPKPCGGGTITSLEDLKSFEDCTHVRGDLTIQISGSNVVQHLEKTLGRVVEIRGFLKISRVYSLNSLDFFKSLKYIEGIPSNSEQNLYFTLVLRQNENLRKLFPLGPNNETVTIRYHPQEGSSPREGNALIHYNPRLCPSEIKKLIKASKLNPNQKPEEISYTNNGDKALCSPDKLKFTVDKNGMLLILTFSNYQKMIYEKDPKADVRGLLGYEIHYREISKATFENRNQTKYGGRDACGSDGWTVQDHTPEGSAVKQGDLTWPDETTFFVVKPYTYYAIFVTTLLLKEYDGTQGINGAQSDMVYVLSDEGYPDPPRSIEFVKSNYSTLNITWHPPAAPNGIIDHYELVLELKETDLNKLSERDYCHSPSYRPPPDTVDVKTNKKKSNNPSMMTQGTLNTLLNGGRPGQADTCDCRSCPGFVEGMANNNDGEDLSIGTRMEKDNFLNLVVNRVFESPAEEGSRRKRSQFSGKDDMEISPDSNEISKTSPMKPLNSMNEEVVFDGIVRTPVTTKSGNVATRPNNTVVRDAEGNIDYYVTFSAKVNGSQHHLLVTKLKHFGSYSFKIRACHAPKEMKEMIGMQKWCSGTVLTNARVAAKPMADDIPGTLRVLSHNESDTAIISWNPPKDPNDVIVKYNVRYKSKEDSKDSTTSCVLAHKIRDLNYIYEMPVVGSYYVSVQAVSLYGPGNWTDFEWVVGPNQGGPSALTIVLVCVLILVFLGVGFGVTFKIMIKKNAEPTFSGNPSYLEMQYVADDWEVNRNLITVGDELGKGAFATVYKGVYKDPKKGVLDVAMKTPKESATHNECMLFLNEAHMMKPIVTPHIVRLIGVVSVNTPYWVILEFMALGDLKSYLKTMRPGSEYNVDGRPPPTAREVKQMALEIADGMAYLANRLKSVVHRDLAARNCLVSKDKVVKIADFGMAREIYSIYTKHDKGMMPIRWMPPESLRGEATIASDVWSFGVVLWEMVTLADQPYRGMSNNEVMDHVMRGGILDRPEDCPDDLFDLMNRCWQTWQSRRPSFLDICHELLPVSNERFKNESYFTSTEGQQAYRTQEENRRIAAEEAEATAALENTPCLTGNGNSNSHSGNGELYSATGGSQSGPGQMDSNGKVTFVSGSTPNDSRGFARQSSTPNNISLFNLSTNNATTPNQRFIKWSNPILKRYRNKSGSTSGEA
eukprot:TCALIF_09701-PA protein Name:"Similar to INSR Insulin receptor (Homo sapiens)" AED:0.09 eAED:0.20 QI:0/0.77/0.8/1/1/1/10/426/1712